MTADADAYAAAILDLNLVHGRHVRATWLCHLSPSTMIVCANVPSEVQKTWFVRIAPCHAAEASEAEGFRQKSQEGEEHSEPL